MWGEGRLSQCHLPKRLFPSGLGWNAHNVLLKTQGNAYTQKHQPAYPPPTCRGRACSRRLLCLIWLVAPTGL